MLTKHVHKNAHITHTHHWQVKKKKGANSKKKTVFILKGNIGKNFLVNVGCEDCPKETKL